MPQLRFLDIQDRIRLDLDKCTHPPVTLQNLTELVLRDTMERCVWFLNNVSFPIAAYVTIKCTDRDYRDFPSLCTAVADRLVRALGSMQILGGALLHQAESA